MESHGGTCPCAFSANWQGPSSNACGLQTPMVLKPKITNCLAQPLFEGSSMKPVPLTANACPERETHNSISCEMCATVTRLELGAGLSQACRRNRARAAALHGVKRIAHGWVPVREHIVQCAHHSSKWTQSERAWCTATSIESEILLFWRIKDPLYQHSDRFPCARFACRLCSPSDARGRQGLFVLEIEQKLETVF